MDGEGTMSGLELDPRWDWIEVPELGSAEPRYIKGRCHHLEVVPVKSVTGDEVARLCRTCDAQLPPSGD